MRVLHLAGEYPPLRIGGIATYLENLLYCLRADVECGVVVISGRDYYHDSAIHQETLSFAATIDMDIGQLTSLQSSILGLHELSKLALLENLPVESWDLVHVHDWYGVLHALLYESERGVPFVMTSHLPLRYGFTYSSHRLPLQLKMRLEALGLRCARAALVPSRYVADVLQSEYNLSPGKIIVVPNGVDTRFFSPRGKPSDSSTVLTVGRLNEQKGLDHLIEIFRIILSDLPKARLVIAGDGSYRPTLERLCQKAGLEKSVTLLGYVSHGDLPALYTSCDVFVSTSVHEPFGLTTIEAMSCGIPVVVSSRGGVAEYVRDGVDGFVRLPQRRLEFARAVKQLLRDRSLRKTMGARARQQAQAFAWRKVAREVYNVYRNVLTQRANPREEFSC